MVYKDIYKLKLPLGSKIYPVIYTGLLEPIPVNAKLTKEAVKQKRTEGKFKVKEVLDSKELKLGENK